jgi:hypothetical protein
MRFGAGADHMLLVSWRLLRPIFASSIKRRMKCTILMSLLLLSAGAYADCDLTSPKVQEMIEVSLKSRTDVDLKKTFRFNVFKSEKYSVYIVQFKKPGQSADTDAIHTLTTAISCNEVGAPMIDTSMDWAVRLGDFPAL